MFGEIVKRVLKIKGLVEYVYLEVYHVVFIYESTVVFITYEMGILLGKSTLSYAIKSGCRA